MKNEAQQSQSSLVFPVIASLAWTITLLLIGLAGPIFGQMYIDLGIIPGPPGFPCPWYIQAVQATHWAWTVPVGLLSSALLVLGSKHWSAKTSFTVDLGVVILAVATFMMFSWMAISFPIYD